MLSGVPVGLGANLVRIVIRLNFITLALILKVQSANYSMASLTEASILARKGVRFGIYLIIFIVVARFAWMGARSIFTQLNPPEPPKATAVFGKIPVLPFPEKQKLTDVVYKLETVQGILPTFPEILEVYEMPQPQSSIAGLDAAKKKANALRFNSEGRLVVENVPNVYMFRRLGEPASFTINIITGVFSISYDIASNPSVIVGVPPAPASAITDANALVKQVGLEEKILTGEPKTELLKIENGRFVTADSLSDAQITKVNLFRKNYGVKGDIPVLTPDYPESNVWFMFAGDNGEVIAAEYHYFTVDDAKYGTYPLKSAQEAWDELTSGNAYIANSGNRNSNEVIIRKVYLAYYDAGQYTPYFQPIIVFEGDGGFIAYVQAVESEQYSIENN